MKEKELYIARDKDNALCAYDQEPYRHDKSGFWTTTNGMFVPINELEDLCPELKNIKWSDTTPIKVKLTVEDTK